METDKTFSDMREFLDNAKKEIMEAGPKLQSMADTLKKMANGETPQESKNFNNGKSAAFLHGEEVRIRFTTKEEAKEFFSFLK